MKSYNLQVPFINNNTLTLHTLTTTLSPPLSTPATLRPFPGGRSNYKSWRQNESPPHAMSLSYSNFFPDDDLLCCEETSSILSGDSPTESLSDVDSSPPPEEEFITGLIDDEHKFVLGFDYFSKLQSRKIDASARTESVAWILKVNVPNLTVFLQSDIHFHIFFLI